MKVIPLLIVFVVAAQVAGPLPVTIEARQDVEVTHHTEPVEGRGKLYLDDIRAQAFRIKKSQRFQMVAVGQERSCRIKVEDKEYGITSCPWLPGFRDHQTDIFAVVIAKK